GSSVSREASPRLLAHFVRNADAIGNTHSSPISPDEIEPFMNAFDFVHDLFKPGVTDIVLRERAIPALNGKSLGSFHVDESPDILKGDFPYVIVRPSIHFRPGAASKGNGEEMVIRRGGMRK